MGRAERRREMKKGEKMKKPPVYNYTPESLRGQLKWEANQEFQEKVKKIKAEVYDDAVNWQNGELDMGKLKKDL